jgi:Domain of unknown function (DUF5916)/Carbohydrate family 9 binding domain-like
MKQIIIFLLYSFLFSALATAQDSTQVIVRKKMTTKRISENIKIDGEFSESAWQNVLPAKDFVMFNQDNGKPEPNNQKTEVKVLYDNDAIYIGAKLYDSEPSKIMKEIAERDDFGTADFFGVFLNGFNDGQQEFCFFVTAANSQADCIRLARNEDFSWDAIWLSQIKIVNDGWQVEMKIPYAALRFAKQDVQTWGINFFREIRRDRANFTWNRLNNAIGTVPQQAGILEGIENIQTPTRLFLIPYSSFYLNSAPDTKALGTIRGGLDLKYGINDAFTLDAVLVPDFGQTKFDNVVLNLGPFEQVFNENRPFFTEGTDLFNKGDIFYSRRIGAAPRNNITLSDTETFDNFPQATNLINAIKVSGRTSGGLGIGVINALTENTVVSIKDNRTLEEVRRVLVAPLTTYNMLVADQRFNDNSSITYATTNVIREGDFRDAHVSALVYDITSKNNKYQFEGNIKYSFVNQTKDAENKKGINTEAYFNEITGKWRYGFGGELMTENYDPTDLGINFITNFYALRGRVNYQILQSTKKFNSFRLNINTNAEFNKTTNKIQDHDFNIGLNMLNKKNHAFGFGSYSSWFKTYDYYDPRVAGRFVINPIDYGIYGYISTNYNNKFAFDINPTIGASGYDGMWNYDVSVSPRYRFNDRFNLILRTSFSKDVNDFGWVDQDNNGQLVYGIRDNSTVEFNLEGKYSINANMNFNLNLRQYWSASENKSYARLLDNGTLEAYNYAGNRNNNLNIFNFDLNYSWWFAPGSQMNILYRSNAFLGANEIDKRILNNLSSNLQEDFLTHSFSISVRYFVDYNQAKNVFRKKV